MNLIGKILIIDGNIGAGKSILGKSIEKYLKDKNIKVRYYKEYLNEKLLNMYISDMKKYGYIFQMVMMLKKIQIYKEAKEFVKNKGIAILDRSILGDYSFAYIQKKRGNICKEEFEIYKNIKDEDFIFDFKSDIIIYLKCKKDILKERIKKRGNIKEIDAYDDKYLEDIEKGYEKIIKKYGLNINLLEWNKNIDIKEFFISEKIIEDFLNKLKIN